MRRLGAALAVALLAACQLTLPGGADRTAEPSPITGPAIEVTSLDALADASLPPPANPASTTPAASTTAPAAPTPAEPAPAPAAPAEAAPPPPPKSPAQIACEKDRGRWSPAGATGTMICLRTMRDAGKQCRRDRDCEGQCLARSGTCAPIAPLFGCNDVLQDDGRRMTLCLD